ncbi:MAG: hypothetical protein RRB22_07695 [Gammaproteobacteria bacterium]|nr:hypothetical protein [Gammaproteobacteria bacterium]
MTLLESLLHPEMLLALGLFAAISVAVEIAGYRLLLAISDVSASSWLMAHTIIPAARALSLVAFILIAYPVLFGVATSLPFSKLLAAGEMRFTHLVNVVFLLSLLLPMIPVFSRWPALVLPIQAIAAASMVFQWWAETQATTTVQFWPGWTTLTTLLVLAFITHEIASQISHRLEKMVDGMLQRTGSERLIYRTLLMILQVPVILLYTLSLGRQFH